MVRCSLCLEMTYRNFHHFEGIKPIISKAEVWSGMYSLDTGLPLILIIFSSNQVDMSSMGGCNLCNLIVLWLVWSPMGQLITLPPTHLYLLHHHHCNYRRRYPGFVSVWFIFRNTCCILELFFNCVNFPTWSQSL